MPISTPGIDDSPKSSKEIADLVEIVARIIEGKVVSRNINNFYNSDAIASFYSSTFYMIPIHDYLKRHVAYMELSEGEIIALLINFKRYTLKCPEYPLSIYNIHKILAAIIILTHKFCQDKPFDLQFYAFSAMLHVEEMRILEVEMFSMLECELYICALDYLVYKEFIVNTSKAPAFYSYRKKAYTYTITDEELTELSQLRCQQVQCTQSEPASQFRPSAHSQIVLPIERAYQQEVSSMVFATSVAQQSAVTSQPKYIPQPSFAPQSGYARQLGHSLRSNHVLQPGHAHQRELISTFGVAFLANSIQQPVLASQPEVSLQKEYKSNFVPEYKTESGFEPKDESAVEPKDLYGCQSAVVEQKERKNSLKRSSGMYFFPNKAAIKYESQQEAQSLFPSH